MNRSPRRFLKLPAIFLIVLSASVFTLFAEDKETVNLSAHYIHPVTGIIEDSGANPSIGQGMVESVLHPEALIETDGTGQLYVTIRLNLAKYLGSYNVKVQNVGDTDFNSVDAEEVKREKDSLYLRFPIGSRNSIIRIEAEVTAMGRAVVFYGKMGTENISTENAPTENNPTGNTSTKDIYHGLLMKGDPRLGVGGGQEEVKAESAVEKNYDEAISHGIITSSAIQSLFIVFGILSLSTLLCGIIVAVNYYNLRRVNDFREADLYGFGKKD